MSGRQGGLGVTESAQGQWHRSQVLCRVSAVPSVSPGSSGPHRRPPIGSVSRGSSGPHHVVNVAHEVERVVRQSKLGRKPVVTSVVAPACSSVSCVGERSGKSVGAEAVSG